MTVAERRRTPRAPVETLSYINFGTSNGGIVSDVSAGGLGFRVFAPVPKSGTIRFSFSVENRQMDAIGELVWTDATRRRGGLRFTSSPWDVRQNPVRRQSV